MNTQTRMASVIVALADQGTQSIASLVLTILIARRLEPTDFGRWAIAAVVFVSVWGLVRTIFVEPFLISQASKSPGLIRQQAGALRRLLVLGFAVPAGICLFVAFLLDGIWRDAFAFVGLVFFPIAILESARAVAIACRDHRRTLLISGTWLFGLAVGVLITNGSPSFRQAMAIFWIAVAVASLWGVMPSMASAESTSHDLIGSTGETESGFRFQDVRSIGFPMAPEFGLTLVASQALVPMIAALGTISAAAGMRGAFTIGGPMTTLIAGLRLGVLADATRFDAKTTDTNWWHYFVQGSVLLGAASLPLALLLWAGTKVVGPEMLGATWPLTEPLVLPILGASLLTGPQLVGLSILRAQKATQQLLKIRVGTTVVILVPAAIGAIAASEIGAAYGYLLGMVLALPLWIAPIWRGRNTPASTLQNT